MAGSVENWKTQIRKGYLELCVLLCVRQQKKVYGFDLIERLASSSLEVKEGTLYPLLNRMAADGLLASAWETEGAKGHPRKFYSLTRAGSVFLKQLEDEYLEMVSIFKKLSQ
jgi:PadR family transcriptional regulator PadR